MLLHYVEESEDVAEEGQLQLGAKCKEEKEQAKCLHSGGNYYTWSAQCPKRFKEMEIITIRAEKGLS